MPIASTNFSVVMLLSEIDLNCKLIARAALGLREAATHWIALDKGIDDGKTFPPIDIISRCSVCLGSAAAISRLLLLGDRKGKKAVRIGKRCEILMRLLDQPPLPVISSFSVRNSWEHLDERLDDLLESRASSSYSEVHVAVKPLDTSTFVLRRFDPTSFAIKYGSDSLSLSSLVAEASDLSSRIAGAFKALHASEVHVY